MPVEVERQEVGDVGGWSKVTGSGDPGVGGRWAPVTIALERETRLPTSGSSLVQAAIRSSNASGGYDESVWQPVAAREWAWPRS